MLEFVFMPQFVIEREIPGAGSLTGNQIREVSLQSLATLTQMGPHIQWLHSYVTEDKVYCVYVRRTKKLSASTRGKPAFLRIECPRCADSSIPPRSSNKVRFF
jgi:Protein of unknown function (DUF4242)